MKFLTDRHEIANEINIRKTPVIVIDISKEMNGYTGCYNGDKCIIKDIHCTAKIYSDGKNTGIPSPVYCNEIYLMPESIGIKSGFGFADVRDMVEWRKTVQLNENGEVIVVFDGGDRMYIRRMKVGKATDSAFVYPTATIVDIDA